jgi:hypothetical protein
MTAPPAIDRSAARLPDALSAGNRFQNDPGDRVKIESPLEERISL